MQNIYINRKGKHRKSSVRRGARKELDQKEQKRLLLLGIDSSCTTCSGRLNPIRGHTVTEPVAQCHIRYWIYSVPRIWRIYGHTVWANPTHVQCMENPCTSWKALHTLYCSAPVPALQAAFLHY
jgi:hypothetical protein